ncbi:hypothetical protein [Flaviflexus equikiangi]|uniref:ATP/GTP-binding protein n=1 Tax=Flaviflexus equikiangi TaxID=2758573 RepID=A0ABS2TFP7_9ACTO|nr:hypothetical protein [Flaviflexus equikiangi]MBM9433475.1 hypothetical protein [Flaviflexus equikiangi]
MGKRSRKRPYGDGHIPLNIDRATGGVRRETGPGGRIFQVRSIPSGAKEYRCPGCQQIIRIGTPHVVAWTEDTLWGPEVGIENRRHWHSACWRARDTRGYFF